MIIDVTTEAYIAEIIFCLTAFGCFLWWGIYQYRKKRVFPSNVYSMVGLMFLAQAYATSIGLTARLLRPDQISYYDFMGTNIWATRIWFRLIVEFLLLWHIGKRIFYNFIRNNHPMRRRTDRATLADEVGNIYTKPLPEEEMEIDLLIKQLPTSDCPYRKAAEKAWTSYLRLKQHHENDHQGLNNQGEKR